MLRAAVFVLNSPHNDRKKQTDKPYQSVAILLKML